MRVKTKWSQATEILFLIIDRDVIKNGVKRLPLYPPPPPPAVQAPPPPPNPPKVDHLSLDWARGHEDPPSAPPSRGFPALGCGMEPSLQPPPPPTGAQIYSDFYHQNVISYQVIQFHTKI